MPATKKTTKKTTAKKTESAQEAMTYGQVKALAAALSHAKRTKGQMSEAIDNLLKQGGQKVKNEMPADKKAKWLEEHGNEPATYGQCMMYAMTLFKAKHPKEAVSEIIEGLDKASGYQPKPKEAKPEEPAEQEEAEEQGAE